MVEKIGEAAVLEMIAEECSELSHAALKLARAVRGENPTPKSEEKCRVAVMEEWADVLVCSEYLDECGWFRPEIVNQCIRMKKQRTKERMKDAKDCIALCSRNGDEL